MREADEKRKKKEAEEKRRKQREAQHMKRLQMIKERTERKKMHDMGVLCAQWSATWLEGSVDFKPPTLPSQVSALTCIPPTTI